MSEDIPYTPGTWVWALIMNRIWWPGKIVTVSSIIERLNDEVKIKKIKKNAKSAVLFEKDGSYEIIVNWDKVILYSCVNKLEFVEKGYLLYTKQKNNDSVMTGGIDMNNFIDDVLSVEIDIGGDVHIFDQFHNKIQTQEKERRSLQAQKEKVKELFISEKERKKRNKQKYLLAKKRKPNNRRYHSFPKQKSNRKSVAPTYFQCPFCKNFSTLHYYLLKRHMVIHINDNKDIKIEENNNLGEPSETTKLINTSNFVEKKLPVSTRDDFLNKISDVQNKLKNEILETQMENITTDMNMEAINDEGNCSNIDNVQLESKTENFENKTNANLRAYFESYFSSLPEQDRENLYSKDLYTKELFHVDFSNQLRVSTYPSNDNNIIKGFITKIVPPIKYVEEKPDHMGSKTADIPRTTPILTDEELISSETYKQIKEMLAVGGQLHLEFTSPEIDNDEFTEQ